MATPKMVSEPAPAQESLSTALAKVRRLTTSSLPHQSKPAQLLVAVESTISSTLPSTSIPTPTAYFAALVQCLEKACADEAGGQDEDMAETENMGQGALIPATLYLLAIVTPETANQVVLSKLASTIECLVPLFESALEHPPALRSLLQITTCLFLVTPPAQLNSSPLLKKTWNYTLELNLDPRPKVRHLAQEGVRRVLCTPIPPRLVPGAHPCLPRAREWVTGVLKEEIKSGGSSSKGKRARFADGEDTEGKRVIWVVQGLRGWVMVWGDEQLSSLCSLLLSLPPLPHLTPQIYSLLAHVLAPAPIDAPAQPSILTNLPTIINSLLASPPELRSNPADIPTYLSALTSALVKMSLQDPVSLSAYLPKTFSLIFTSILLSPSASPSVLSVASESIGSHGIVRYCITDEMILSSVEYSRQGSLEDGARKKQKTPFLTRLILAVTGALDTHALRIGHLLPILTALVSRLRVRVTTGMNPQIDPTGQCTTAAEELLMDLVRDVGDLRTQNDFEERAKVDELLGMSIEVMGVIAVLHSLPINIEPDANGNTPQPGRAHLLPLIRSRVTNDSLAFFADYFRPLSERVFGRKAAAEESGRDAEAKVWEVVVGQIWDCFPGFCEMPRDLKLGLTTPFLTLLTNLLYTQPLLLSPLLRGLSQLVTSTQRLASSASAPEELCKQFGVNQSAANENLAYLKTLAKDVVSVLLNVFSKLPREQRGMVGEVIGHWVGILTDKDVVATYTTVTTHLSANLTHSTPSTPGSSPISHTMLDLLIIFVVNLPPTQSIALFTATATGTMLEHSDATVQKKSYRLLKRLLEAGKLGNAVQGKKLEEFVVKLGEAGGGAGPGAQRDRLQLLSVLVESLPKDHLHLVPELLSEAVLGTKEVNERARDAGFDLLVVMGRKMAKGGTVKQTNSDDAEMADGVDASVEEFITMVAAGLTGTTPHMISASINALSRLVFEFKDDVSDDMLSELTSTTAVFLASKNREIVKSALGFIKLLIITLPPTLVKPHLPALIPALLGWVHDHKNHFKQKTVHIFERMIRRFGFEEVYKHAPEGGERKVLEGIKKRKERAKRKKAKADAEGSAEEQAPKASSGNAFEDVLYNSESEDDSSDDDDVPAKRGGVGTGNRVQAGGRPIKSMGGKKGRGEMGASYIRNEGDEPMDLLSRSIAGGITRADPSGSNRKRKPGQDASHFQTDTSGRLIIPDDHDDSQLVNPKVDVEGTAYMSAQRGVDGQSRDAKGNLRFNKNTKRTREDDGMMMDLDEVMGGSEKEKKKKKKRDVEKLGGEFRSKRAGGDIKRDGGPDPYSYVPIGQAAKKGNQTGRVNLTNKKKGSRR